MGKNNRPRAAKQRAKRRNTSGQARPSGRAHPDTGEARQSSEELRQQQAEQSLDRLLRFRARGPLIRHVVEHELVSLQPDSLRMMDELITGRLLLIVTALWEQGWQPLDLVHVVRKAIRGPRS